ncbi:MAG: ABC transporter ATP-binding protein [Planctomycetota bacterium]
MSNFDEIELDQPQKVDFGIWKKLLRYTLHYRTTVKWFAVSAFGIAVCDVGFPIVTGRLISAVERGDESLARYGWAFLALAAGICVAIWGFIRSAAKIRTHVSHDIRRDAFEHLQELSFSFYDVRPVGWLMARLTSDCQRLSNILAWGVMDFIWGGTLMLGIVIAMLVVHPALALVVLVVTPLLFVTSVFFQKRILKTSRVVRKINSKITANYNEGIMGVRTTKVFVREQENLRDFDRLADEMRVNSVRNALLSAVYLPLVLTLSSLAVGGALAYGGHKVAGGAIDIGTLFMFMYFARMFFQPVQELSAWIAEMQMAQASAERILGVIETVPEVRDTPEAAARLAAGPYPESQAPDGLPDRLGRIEFEGVGFAYRNGSKVIENLNLTVEPGQTIALVGATGGGKSTIVNLLCRFYEPTEGRILIDGIDYTDRSLLWLQSQLGIVLQQPHLFRGTITENIRYGELDATDEQIEAAAELAGAHEFISELENGYATEVGEGGNRLSLGQKQLVSFARAVLKRPRLLVMDEATSSIDTETERIIQTGLARVLSGRTSFVIAHRLSTIRAADRILVIDGGKIIEQGNHGELLAHRGRYYDLYTEQSMRDTVTLDQAWTD